MNERHFFWSTELCGRVGAPQESMERGREGGGKQTRRDHKASFSGSVTDSHHHHIFTSKHPDSIFHMLRRVTTVTGILPPPQSVYLHLSIHPTICAAPEPTLHPVLASKAPLFKPPILVPHSVVSHLPHSSISSQRCLVLHPPPASMCQHSFFSSPFIPILFLSSYVT